MIRYFSAALLFFLLPFAACISQPPLPGALPPLTNPQDKEIAEEASFSPDMIVRELLQRQDIVSPKELVSAFQQQLENGDLRSRLDALASVDLGGELTSKTKHLLTQMIQSEESPLQQVLAAAKSVGPNADNETNKLAMERLSQGLRSSDSAVVFESAIGLQLAGAQAEKIFAEALEDDRPSVRALAVESLGRLNSQKTAGKISALLSDDDAAVRAAAAGALRDAAGTLRDAAGALGAGDNPIQPLLQILLHDENDSARANAAAALAGLEHQNQSIDNDLVAGMLDRNEATGIAVIRGVANSQASPEARATLLGAALKKASPAHAAEIIGHLVECGIPGRDALIRCLDSKVCRYWAVVALAEYGTDALPASRKLISMLETSTPDVKTEILFTLSHVQPDPADVTEAILREMESEHAGVRYAATLAAIRLELQSRGVQRRLAANENSDDKMLALISTFALAKLNPDTPSFGLKAIKSLGTAIRSNDPRLKRLAELALRDLKPQALPPFPKLP